MLKERRKRKHGKLNHSLPVIRKMKLHRFVARKFWERIGWCCQTKHVLCSEFLLFFFSRIYFTYTDITFDYENEKKIQEI